MYACVREITPTLETQTIFIWNYLSFSKRQKKVGAIFEECLSPFFTTFVFKLFIVGRRRSHLSKNLCFNRVLEIFSFWRYLDYFQKSVNMKKCQQFLALINCEQNNVNLNQLSYPRKKLHCTLKTFLLFFEYFRACWPTYKEGKFHQEFGLNLMRMSSSRILLRRRI